MSRKLQNMFYAKEIDITKFDYPEAKVRVWSVIMGTGSKLGSFNVEPEDNRKLSYSNLTIKQYDIFHRDLQSVARKKAKAVAKTFNKDLKKNWDKLLLSTFIKLVKYYEKSESDFEGLELLKKNIKIMKG